MIVRYDTCKPKYIFKKSCPDSLWTTSIQKHKKKIKPITYNNMFLRVKAVMYKVNDIDSVVLPRTCRRSQHICC